MHIWLSRRTSSHRVSCIYMFIHYHPGFIIRLYAICLWNSVCGIVPHNPYRPPAHKHTHIYTCEIAPLQSCRWSLCWCQIHDLLGVIATSLAAPSVAVKPTGWPTGQCLGAVVGGGRVDVLEQGQLLVVTHGRSTLHLLLELLRAAEPRLRHVGPAGRHPSIKNK